MHTLLADIRYAARKLMRAPAFTATAVLTLTLAIGSTTALFSIVNSVVLEPLPFAHPDRLAFVSSTSPSGRQMPVSPQNLIDYRDQSHVFSGVAAVDAGESATLTRPDAPATRLSEARVGADFFRVLGVQPAVGRFFAAGEDSSSAAKVVVLSDLAWRRYFNGDARVVGQPVTLDGTMYRVIGVAKPGLDYPQGPDIWIPAVWMSFELGDAARGYNAATAVARLKDGMTFDRARLELQTIADRLADRFPNTNAKVGAFIDPLQHQLVGDVTHALWPMLGAVVLVLLIACTNVANLLLVRGAGRESELAVRTALGAGRGRIMRQLVTESMLLWIAGAAFGALFASWSIGAVIAFGPRGLPRLHEIAIDGRVVAFTAFLTVVTGLVFGSLPAFQAARLDISQMLRAGARGAGAIGGNRTRSALVVAEVALATVLLVGAGLLIKSFERLTRVDPGFRPSHLVVLDAALSGDRYRHDAENNAFAANVESRIASLPGVQSAAVGAARPLDPDGPFGASTSFTVDNESRPKPGTEPTAHVVPVSPSYFATLGATVERGRVFTASENRLDVPPVLLIDEELARRYFANVNPIGKRLTFGLSHSITGAAGDTVRMRGEVIGVVKNIVRNRLGETPEPTAYFPYATAPFAATFVVRTDADPTMVEGEIRRAVHEVDPNVSLYELGTMDDAMSESVAQPRFYTLLLTVFSALALLLAAVGIFGVMSYVVGQRTREFGIRIALGATAHHVVRSVVRRGLVIGLGGIAAGTIAAAVATRGIRALLYGTDPLDLPAFVGAALILAAVAALAAWLPARRAARVDPVTAMRAD
jgi:putative ABC transport system permease protein